MPPDWFDLVQKGGAYVSPLLLAALLWMNSERSRLLQRLKERDDRIDDLAERIIVVATELRTFLFVKGRADS
jgi:hypothetical protein